MSGPARTPAVGTVPLSVRLGEVAAQAAQAHVPTLVGDHVARRLAGRDADLWGRQAADEAARRLGWVDLPKASVPLVPTVIELRDELAAEGLDRVVLCGMGGSSLAPEVITGVDGVPLVVLDGTDPQQVRRAVSTDLQRTAVVVSSKSGSTVETDSQRRAFEAAFAAAGIDPATRMLVVTDAGSPLQEQAVDAGYRRVFVADSDVGGRYSALTAFGLVPSGLAGADIGRLLAQAAAVAPSLARDEATNPALVLGAALGGTDPLRDKVVLVDDGSGLTGFGDWAEQLLAESTGKEGTGLLPVVVAGTDAPELQHPADDVLVVRLAGPDADLRPGPCEVVVAGDLGAQLQLFQTATAVAGRLLGINPFDQPDVESAKSATRALLETPSQVTDPPAFTDGGIAVRGSDGLLDGARDLDGALGALLGQLDGDRGYVAVMAYLDREGDAALAGVREVLARRCRRPVTFGWGPRFLHSTGQYHKGGPATGVYLQVTADADQDVEVPGRPFTFGQLIAAQATGDAQVLSAHGRPVLRLHLADRAAGVDRLLSAAGPGG